MATNTKELNSSICVKVLRNKFTVFVEESTACPNKIARRLYSKEIISMETFQKIRGCKSKDDIREQVLMAVIETVNEDVKSFHVFCAVLREVDDHSYAECLEAFYKGIYINNYIIYIKLYIIIYMYEIFIPWLHKVHV